MEIEVTIFRNIIVLHIALAIPQGLDASIHTKPNHSLDNNNKTKTKTGATSTFMQHSVALG